MAPDYFHIVDEKPTISIQDLLDKVRRLAGDLTLGKVYLRGQKKEAWGLFANNRQAK